MQAPCKEGKRSPRLKLRCGDRTGKEWRRRLEVGGSLQAPAKAGTIEPSLTKEMGSELTHLWNPRLWPTARHGPPMTGRAHYHRTLAGDGARMTFPLGHPLMRLVDHTAPVTVVYEAFQIFGKLPKGKLEGDSSSARRVRDGYYIPRIPNRLFAAQNFYSGTVTSESPQCTGIGVRRSQISTFIHGPGHGVVEPTFGTTTNPISTDSMSINHRSSTVRAAWVC